MAIVEVIKYNGTPDVFAWKYPNDELGTWTQLIVNESQEAILYKGGQALDIFMPGRHTLETANIPILSELIKLPFGGRSPFSAEVWYINKVHSLDIKWGTPTPIQLQDPKYKVFVPLRSFGQFGIQISDSKKFLTKLVGTLAVFDKDNITKFFRGLYLTKVKDAISSYLVNKEISILEINSYLNELSEYLKDSMEPTLEQYGIKLLNFYVNDINVPEDDTAVKKLKEALAKKAEMDIVGYNYVQERSFDTLEGAATNTSSGQAGFMGAGIGLGMGVGVGGAIGNQFAGMTESINPKQTKQCDNCGAEVEINKKFCPECGFNMKKENSNEEEIKCSGCANIYKKCKFCPECGKRYNPCVFCGNDLDTKDTVCSKCGKETPKPCSKCGHIIKDNNVKFCPECGENFVKKCSKCGEIVKDNQKFCLECGNKLKEEV